MSDHHAVDSTVVQFPTIAGPDGLDASSQRDFASASPKMSPPPFPLRPGTQNGRLVFTHALKPVDDEDRR